jgi:hypothetical protein
MARPRKDQTNTTSVVEQTEKTTEVEQTENATTENNSVVADEKPVETPETKPVDEKPEETTVEEKPIDDDEKIVIKCAAYAGKSIVLPTRTIQLDEKGCCEVTGIEAKRLLTIPGYERA